MIMLEQIYPNDKSTLESSMFTFWGHLYGRRHFIETSWIFSFAARGWCCCEPYFFKGFVWIYRRMPRVDGGELAILEKDQCDGFMYFAEYYVDWPIVFDVILYAALIHLKRKGKIKMLTEMRLANHKIRELHNERNLCSSLNLLRHLAKIFFNVLSSIVSLVMWECVPHPSGERKICWRNSVTDGNSITLRRPCVL